MHMRQRKTDLPNVKRHSALDLRALPIRDDRVKPVVLVAARFEQEEQIRCVAFFSYQDVTSIVSLKHVDDIRVEGSISVGETRITTAGSDGAYTYQC